MEAVPARYGKLVTLLGLDVESVANNIRELVSQQASFLSEAADTLSWAFMKEGRKYTGEGGLSELGTALVHLSRAAQTWRLRIFKLTVTPNMGLVLPSAEWLSVFLDLSSMSLGFEAAVVGQDKADSAYRLVISDLRVFDIGLPEHHRHVEAHVRRLLEFFPDPTRNIFLMMRFEDDSTSKSIHNTIKSTCKKRDINILRADDREYTSDLLDNVLTYIYGCAAGIAVFEEVNYRERNPNVAIEVGFFLASGKPLLLLKDKAIRALPADIIGRIYQPFDT